MLHTMMTTNVQIISPAPDQVSYISRRTGDLLIYSRESPKIIFVLLFILLNRTEYIH